MTEGLVAQLTAAIDADQQAAHAATAGPWKVDHETYPEYISNDDGVQVVAGGRWGGEGSVFETNADALHIARHDPATILRGCATDRRVLARHQAKTGCREVHPDGRHDSSCFDCAYCDTAYWPCPDLRDLAERLGVATEPCGP